MNPATWAVVAVAALVLISAGLTAAWRRIEGEQTAWANETAADWEQG